MLELWIELIMTCLRYHHSVKKWDLLMDLNFTVMTELDFTLLFMKCLLLHLEIIMVSSLGLVNDLSWVPLMGTLKVPMTASLIWE